MATLARDGTSGSAPSNSLPKPRTQKTRIIMTDESATPARPGGQRRRHTGDARGGRPGHLPGRAGQAAGPGEGAHPGRRRDRRGPAAAAYGGDRRQPPADRPARDCHPARRVRRCRAADRLLLHVVGRPSRGGAVRRLHVGHHASQRAVLQHLDPRDITYAVFCQGPYAESARYHDFMAWDMPWYSAQDSLDELLTGRRVGRMHIVCYLRDGDRVFEPTGPPCAASRPWTTATRSWT